MNGHQDVRQQVRGAYFCALLSAMTSVVGNLLNAYISRNVITVQENVDKVVAACVLLTLTGVIGSIVFVFLACTPVAKVMAPKYRGFSFGTAKLQKNALIGGVCGALATGFTLLAFQKDFDAAMVVALGSSQVLWVIVYEYFKSTARTSLRKVIVPAGLMIVGVWIGHGVSSLSREAILLIFVAAASLDAISSVHDKIAAQAEKSDATLATVWRFIYFGGFGTLISFLYVWHLHKFPLYVDLLIGELWRVVPFITALMILNFFVNGLRTKAKKDLPTMGASKVAIIANLKIVGVLFVLGVIQYVFGWEEFGQLPTDKFLLAKRILGALVITASVVWLMTEEFARRKKGVTNI